MNLINKYKTKKSDIDFVNNLLINLNNNLKNQNIDADAFLGGSFAKKTYLEIIC